MAIYGVQPYGIGTPAPVTAATGIALKDPVEGQQQGSRKINPATGDYVLDTTSMRIQGMSDTKQLVLLAVNTTKGSSAMRSLGHEIRSIDRITSNFVRRVDSTLRMAVQHIVNRGLIEVVSVDVEVVRPGVALARLRWRDLSSGVEDETLIGEQSSEF